MNILIFPKLTAKQKSLGKVLELHFVPKGEGSVMGPSFKVRPPEQQSEAAPHNVSCF